jgi:hypothetical protein
MYLGCSGGKVAIALQLPRGCSKDSEQTNRKSKFPKLDQLDQ